MKNQQNDSSGAYALRITFSLALLLISTILLVSSFNAAVLPAHRTADSTVHLLKQSRTLSFADRVAYQRAVEEVYWRHRIWPNENRRTKPPLASVMSETAIENKVKDYLRNSELLEQYWQRPITPEQLQAEMERMARHTKQPDILREVFAALGNDPGVIAECVARPALAERLVESLYAHDSRFHGELKRRAEAELEATHGIGQMK